MHICLIHVYILLCCHGNNRFSIFVHVHVQCMSPCRMWNISMDFLSANTPHFLRLWLDTGLSFTAKLMSDCCRLQSIPPYSCSQDWESDRDSGATPLPPGPSQPYLHLPRLTSPVDPHHVCQRTHHLYNNVIYYIFMYSCAMCTTVYLILLHEERHHKTTTVPCCLLNI